MTAMTVQPTPSGDEAHAAWQSALAAWLGLGGFALLCVPALRGVDPWFGWLPFWLVVAPALDLAFLRRRWIAERLLAGVGRWQRRRSMRRRQARPLHRRDSRSAWRHSRNAATGAPSQSVMPRRLRSMRRRNSPMMRR